MSYRKDKTTVAQTAANDAAQVVAALITAGVIGDVDGAVSALSTIQGSLFELLAPVVDTDNALFAEVEASQPAAKPRASGGSRSGGGSTVVETDGSTVVSFGAFKDKGLTIADVFALSADEASAITDGGYAKAGSEYITWMQGNDKNPYMQKRATAFLDNIRAGSDA